MDILLKNTLLGTFKICAHATELRILRRYIRVKDYTSNTFYVVVYDRRRALGLGNESGIKDDRK